MNDLLETGEKVWDNGITRRRKEGTMFICSHMRPVAALHTEGDDWTDWYHLVDGELDTICEATIDKCKAYVEWPGEIVRISR